MWMLFLSQSYWQSLHTEIFMLCSISIAAKRASFFLHVNAYQNIIGEECNRLWSTALSRCRWGGVPAPLFFFTAPAEGNIHKHFQKVGVVEQNHILMGAGDVSSSLCWAKMIAHPPQNSRTLTVCSHFIYNPILCWTEVASQHVMKQPGSYLISSHRLPNAQTYVGRYLCQSIKALPLPRLPSLCLCLRVDSILEDVQVVGGCYGNDILRWVPSHVQDFLRKVQTIHANVSAAALTTGVNSPGPQHSPRLAAFSPSLQGHTTASLPVKHAEEAVVCPCHDDAEERTDADNEMS